MTLQSVMRAIDKDEEPLNITEGFEGLSIMDESFLEKMEGLKTQKWSYEALGLSTKAPKQSESNPNTNNDSNENDEELWQALMLEQKTRYEGQISRLKSDLNALKKTVNSPDNSRQEKFERKKWEKFNQILDSYFAEYHVQI